jgi:hypothetical protein
MASKGRRMVPYRPCVRWTFSVGGQKDFTAGEARRGSSEAISSVNGWDCGVRSRRLVQDARMGGRRRAKGQGHVKVLRIDIDPV